MANYIQIIRRHCKPLDPISTNQTKRLTRLDDIRAVLFDVYGTLIISASGDVGAHVDAAKSTAFMDALLSVNIDVPCSAEDAFREFIGMIRTHHTRAKSAGVDFPEVDIVSVWQESIQNLLPRDQLADLSSIDWKRLAVEYEVRVNPTWPMPGLLDTTSSLQASGKLQGIVSNAQFFTPELFPALVDKSVNDLGFDPQLQYYSYLFGHAKPGVRLYELAAEALRKRGILPSQTLYVGNDMLNDVRAASLVGFRTALFAGDERSLRLREDDARVAGILPDLLITELADLGTCV